MANYRAMAVAAARRAGINPEIFLRQINQESGFNPRAHSPAGAEGIAQFMPSTAAAHHINPDNPQQALNAAAMMDAQAIKRDGGWAPALSEYNSGNPNAYKDPHFAGGQTYHYVQDILGGGNIPIPHQAAPQQQLVKLAGSSSATLHGPNNNALLAANLIQAAASNAGTPVSPLMQLALQRQQLQSAQQANGPIHPSQAHTPAPQPHSRAPSGLAGGFLPKGALYTPGRKDQGRDGQTAPGAPILAPGNGVVVRVASDPNGFGPDYPIIHYTSGPYKGQDIYVGHTHATVRPGQHVAAGQVISRTGTTPVGNASVPGWFEIGFAPGGTPGAFGQSTPF